MMKNMLSAVVFLFLMLLQSTAQSAEPPQAKLVEIQKIWDRAPHNAFTDLIRYKGQWYCVFREGQAHVSPDGALRVITSKNGREWKSSALLTSPTADLRDAKIAITPDQQLMLSGAAALHQPAEARHQTLAWFSEDGQNWSDPVKIGEPDFWLWRVTWHKGAAYGIGYATAGEKKVRLYRSEDGHQFETWVSTLFDEGYPNETSLVFLPNDTGLCLLRRDRQPNSAQLGVAQPPYKKWEWLDLGTRIGGPHMIRLPDGRMIAAGRSYDGGAKTRLWSVDLRGDAVDGKASCELQPLLTLPSGGDTSYPGLVFHEGFLWISYYSSHEGKTSIYLAKVKLP